MVFYVSTVITKPKKNFVVFLIGSSLKSNFDKNTFNRVYRVTELLSEIVYI